MSSPQPPYPSNQPSYGQPGTGQSGYGQSSTPDFEKHQPASEQPGNQYPGDPQGSYPQQPGYPQPGYPQPGYPQQPGYPPAGYASPPPGYGPPPPGYGPPPNPYGGGYLNTVQKPTGWFVVNWLFFWPLAIYSLTSAWGNIDRALFAGDVNGAQYQAGRVRKFGIIALCIGIGWIALWIIVAVAVGSTTANYCSGYNC